MFCLPLDLKFGPTWLSPLLASCACIGDFETKFSPEKTKGKAKLL